MISIYRRNFHPKTLYSFLSQSNYNRVSTYTILLLLFYFSYTSCLFVSLSLSLPFLFHRQRTDTDLRRVLLSWVRSDIYYTSPDPISFSKKVPTAPFIVTWNKVQKSFKNIASAQWPRRKKIIAAYQKHRCDSFKYFLRNSNCV